MPTPTAGTASVGQRRTACATGRSQSLPLEGKVSAKQTDEVEYRQAITTDEAHRATKPTSSGGRGRGFFALLRMTGGGTLCGQRAANDRPYGGDGKRRAAGGQ